MTLDMCACSAAFIWEKSMVARSARGGRRWQSVRDATRQASDGAAQPPGRDHVGCCTRGNGRPATEKLCWDLPSDHFARFLPSFASLGPFAYRLLILHTDAGTQISDSGYQISGYKGDHGLHPSSLQPSFPTSLRLIYTHVPVKQGMSITIREALEKLDDRRVRNVRPLIPPQILQEDVPL